MYSQHNVYSHNIILFPLVNQKQININVEVVPEVVLNSRTSSDESNSDVVSPKISKFKFIICFHF